MPTRWRYLGLLAIQLAVGCRNGADIVDLELKKIGSYSEVVGFWQLKVVANQYLVILETDDAEERSTLSVVRLLDGEWSTVRKITSDDLSIKAIDGHAIDTKFYICTEVNGNEALQLVSAEVQELVDPEVEQVPFTPLGKLGLTDEQVQSVDLPVDRWWNVIRRLAPEAWLFGTKFVKGDVSTPMVVVSTADGQVAALGLSGDRSVSELLDVRNALDPQAAVSSGVRYVAVKRIDGDVYPFWMLPRYSGPRTAVNGELVVNTGEGQELNLSATLGIGPVMKHALTLDRDSRVWLFALQDAPVGTDVLAIEFGESGWLLRERQSLDLEVAELSVAPGATGWQVVYGVDEEDSWSLYHQTWRITR